jgi:multicomponent Na+:H+ antiporter subunit C
MLLVVAIVIGSLVTCGVYLLFSRRATAILLGLALISHAVNLVVFSSGGLIAGNPPLVPLGTTAPLAGSADPVPQALVLTAIVIGFAVVAFVAAR